MKEDTHKHTTYWSWNGNKKVTCKLQNLIKFATIQLEVYHLFTWIRVTRAPYIHWLSAIITVTCKHCVFYRLCLWTGVVVNRKFNKTIHVLLFAVKLHFLLSLCQWMYFAFSSSDIFMVIRNIPSVQRWIFEIFAFLKLKNWNAFVAFECFWAI